MCIFFTRLLEDKEPNLLLCFVSDGKFCETLVFGFDGNKSELDEYTIKHLGSYHYIGKFKENDTPIYHHSTDYGEKDPKSDFHDAYIYKHDEQGWKGVVMQKI